MKCRSMSALVMPTGPNRQLGGVGRGKEPVPKLFRRFATEPYPGVSPRGLALDPSASESSESKEAWDNHFGNFAPEMERNMPSRGGRRVPNWQWLLVYLWPLLISLLARFVG